jgi:hypothetical protein
VFGALQDPIRKLTPGTPAIMAVSTLPIFCAACLQALSRERAWPALKQMWPRISKPMVWFLISLLPATLYLFRFGLGVWPVAAIGLFGYLAPVAALLLGFVYVRDGVHLRKLLVFYTLFSGLLLSGAFLEYLGFAARWSALGTAAMGMRWIRWFGTQQVDLIAGFYRSPDIMGWHAASVAMFALTLQMDKRRGRVLWLLLAGAGILAAVVAGRRKMVMMPIVWCAFVLVAYLREGRLSKAITLLSLVAGVGAVIYVGTGEVNVETSYYSYVASSQGDALDRTMQSLFGILWETFQQSGPLGVGIGAVSQGTQHVGLEQPLAWQEAGLSKLAVELGAPGLVCALLLVVAIGRGCLRVLKAAVRAPGRGALQVGLAAFGAANGTCFLVSHQVYGDSLVMVLTAFMIGVVLSAPRWSPASAVLQPQPILRREARELPTRGALA